MRHNGQTTVQVIELLNKEPALSSAELAARLGVTRSRISQIRMTIKQQPDRRVNWHPCQACGTLIRARQKFCSRSCRSLWSGGVKLTCETCGGVFIRGVALVEQRARAGQKHVWCSKKCQGSWLGNLRGRLGNFVGR
jgi:hypothetical protein